MSEMYENEYSHVRVLRHRFDTSHMLSEELNGLFKPGSSAGFVFRSTKEAYVDASLYALNRYREEQEKAEELAENLKRKRIAIGSVAVRRLTPGQGKYGGAPTPFDKIRIALLPSDMTLFAQLAASLDVFPDMYPRKEPPRHYLHAEFPARNLRSESELDHDLGIDDAAKRLDRVVRSAVRQGLYSVNLIGIEGGELELPSQKLRPGWRSSPSEIA